MASKDWLPDTEPGLVTWSTNFNARLQDGAIGGIYGLTPQQITDYQTAHDNFLAARVTANETDTRTKTTIQLKNDAKDALILLAREYVKFIQGRPETTDAERVSLNITVPDDEPSTIPAPTTMPVITIQSTVGKTVNFIIRDENAPDTKAKPNGVVSAIIMSYVGDTAPNELTDWSLAKTLTKSSSSFTFPASTPAFSKVWLVALWQNAKGQTGPIGNPVSTNVGEAISQAA